MHVLLTGPFGTIGLHILDELLRRGHAVTCFDLDNPVNRKHARRYGNRIKVTWGDITSVDAVRAAVNGQDAVIHLAAIIPPLSEMKPELAQRVNVQGTQYVIDAIAAQAVQPFLLFPSSVSVHGVSSEREPPCRVDTPLQANDHYAGHKIACEQALRASAIRWVIFRIGACAGADIGGKADQRDEMMKQMFAVHPDTRVEYLHPDDAALAFANALDKPDAVAGKTLFLGSGANSRIRWHQLVSAMPVALGIGELPREAFGTDPFYTDWMDTEETERLLQFQRYGFPQYLKEIDAKFRWIRWLLIPLRGLVKHKLLSASPAWQVRQGKI